LAGFVILNETITGRTAIGGLLIISGMFLAEINFKKQRQRLK